MPSIPKHEPDLSGRPGSNPWLHRSVGQWMALLVIGFFIGPLCVSNLWGYLQSRRYLTDAAARNMRNVAALEASETLHFVGATERLVASIVAGNEHLFALVRGLAATDTGAAESNRLRAELESHLTAKVREDSSARAFLVFSAEGTLLGSTSPVESPRSDPALESCFAAGKSGHGIAGFAYNTDAGAESAESDHHLHDEEGEPDILVASPIRDGAGSFLGVFCGRFSFDVHQSLLAANRERTRNATLYLLDEQGTVVCGSFADGQHAPYGQSIFDSAVAAPRATPWEGRQVLENGEEIMLAYAPIERLDWGIVVEEPVSTALADLDRLKWQAFSASIALGAILCFAVWFVWRTLARPLHKLARASDRMASGAHGETVWPGGPKEVVELAMAFNRMSLALQDSHDHLAARIEERTTELRESQEFTELLLDSIEQRVIVMDRSHRIIKANEAACRIHGRPLEGSLAFEVFEDETELPEGFPAQTTFDEKRPASGERSQLTIHGWEPIQVETYPVFGAEGEVISVVEIGRIVTDEKQLQMQMVYQEKMAAFGQLAAGMAHEIGNPLAAIESQLQIARDDPSRREETLGIVHKQIGRMDRLLREMVDFARRRRDETRLVSVAEVVDDVIRLIEHDPRARTVALIRTGEDAPPGVRAKEDQLVQVLVNLGLNALDAMPSGGEVRFGISSDDDWVTISVSDTGFGIAQEDRNRVFEPFFTTKAAGQGTGLGLFVSRNIVDGMGGFLEIDATGEAGTTLAVRLPREARATGGTAS